MMLALHCEVLFSEYVQPWIPGVNYYQKQISGLETHSVTSWEMYGGNSNGKL